MPQHETNALWEKAQDTWTCSACGRSRQQIVRRDKSGKLIAKIVFHHDHIYEHIRKLFTKHKEELVNVFGYSWGELGEQILKPIQYSSQSFFGSYVCEDCNNVDPRAKKIVGAGKHVSFAPDDIKKFAKPRRDDFHAIDRDALAQVWLVRKPQFDMRDRYIAAHLRMCLAGEHWLQLCQNAGFFRDETCNRPEPDEQIKAENKPRPITPTVCEADQFRPEWM